MKNQKKLHEKLAVRVLQGIAILSKRTAEASAGLASRHGIYQPKVPEKLRR